MRTREMVRFLRETGYSYTRIAREIGVSAPTVFRVDKECAVLRNTDAYGALVGLYVRRVREIGLIVKAAQGRIEKEVRQ